MSKSKKIALLAAALCIIVGGVLVYGTLRIKEFDLEQLSTVQYTEKAVTVSQPFTSVNIENGFADVQIISSLGGSCTVESLEGDGVRFDVQVQEDVLTIQCVDTRSLVQKIGIYAQTPRMTLSLPSERYEALSVTSSSGEVMIPHRMHFDTVTLTAESGDIDFAADAETLTAHTASGDIRLVNSTVQTSTVSTASGECRLTNVTAKGKIQLQTSSGDIQLFGDTAQTLTVSSSSGVCTLFYVTAKGEVQLQTSSGDVTLQNCDAGSLDIRTSSGNVTGTLRGDMKYDAQTQSGDVQVPVSGSAGMCTVRTSSGDINFS